MAAITFATALAIVLRLEGDDQITNDPDDLGGLTKWGITEAVWKQAIAEHIVADKPLKDADRHDAEAIYFALYWRRVGADRLPSPLNLCAFDAAVNQGVNTAALLLQKALRVEEDGVVGVQTIEAAHRATIETTLALLSARLARYELTAGRMLKGDKFIDGWRRRVLRLWRECILYEVNAA